MRDISKWILLNAVATVVLLLLVIAVVAVGWYSNRDRINDIQRSRVESCERTYEGVRAVLRPFFPPKNHRTARQQRDLEKFNRTVDRLKAGCSVQTKGA